MVYSKLIQGLRNIWYWFPIIWRDRQWDHYFFFTIIEHKLRAMERFFSQGGVHRIDSEQSSRRIRYCRMLTTRLIQDSYIENALCHHEQVYGEAEIIRGESDGVSSVVIAVPHLVGKEREIEKEKRHKLYRIATRQEQQDLDVLFEMLRKYIQHWWD